MPYGIYIPKVITKNMKGVESEEKTVMSIHTHI